MNSYFSWLKDKDQTWGQFFFELLVLVAVVVFIRFYVFQFFRVSGPSMCPTLNQYAEKCLHDKGEFIFVNEFIYSFLRTPKRGEVVVFTPPNESGKKYIKRVIGEPGDIITVEEGKVFLKNDTYGKIELPETYLSEKNYGRTAGDRSEFLVPANNYVLFGDNRLKSQDSRTCFGRCSSTNVKRTPFVHESDIEGRSEFVLFPFSHFRFLDNTLGIEATANN